MNDLIFNDLTIKSIVNDNDSQVWITSSELAKALGYKSSKSITNLYNSKSQEFTDSMSKVIDLVTSPTGSSTKTRIFSMRGCHLMGMFARTKIAPSFRVWALDILDQELERNNRRHSITAQLDEVYSIYALEQGKASESGKSLVSWRYIRDSLQVTIDGLKEQLQPQLTGFNEEIEIVEIIAIEDQS